MTRYKVGVGVAALSGSDNRSMGGETWTKSGIVRTRVVPVNPQTASQTAIRALFLFLTSEWSLTLTNAQRLLWEGALSNSYYFKQDALTGTSRPYASAKALFIAMNVNYKLSQGEPFAVATTYLVPGTSAGTDAGLVVTSVVADASAGSVVITYSGAPTLEGMFFRASPPLSPGTMSVLTAQSAIRYIEGALAASPVAVSTAYIAKYGAITAATDKKIFWSVEAIDFLTGRNRIISKGITVIIA